MSREVIAASSLAVAVARDCVASRYGNGYPRPKSSNAAYTRSRDRSEETTELHGHPVLAKLALFRSTRALEETDVLSVCRVET